MTQISITIPGLGDLDGEAPIVILGPNGSGKTQLAQKIAGSNQVSAVSAQRRTWVDDSLPVQEEQQLRNNVRSHIDRWRQNSWQPTEEINFILSTLIQDHTNLLTKKNEEAISSSKPLDPVKDTKLILLQGLWNRLFPKRKLEIGGFFPKVKRLDASTEVPSYQLRQMSDGERTVLYMAARVMTAEHPIVLVDEPELHMHNRLSVQFWDEAEKLRPDCRFVYITHDLNFTLSRRRATVLVARTSDFAEIVSAVDQLPSSIAADVLGAATLPFYAKRIFLFEGEPGKGFASEFFSAWFDDDETFSIPCGDRDSVCAAVSGLKTVGIVAAEVIGLIDRDFYSDSVLGAVTKGVTVLQLHEIESVLCDQTAVASVAEHLGKDSGLVWGEFLDRVRKAFRDQTLNNVVARRVRSRVGDLLDGAFNGAQVVSDLNATSVNHSTTLSALDLPTKTTTMFAEESKRVTDALSGGGKEMLAILPGKHLLSILANVLGLSHTSELTSIVVKALNRKQLKADDPLRALGSKVEAALLAYLPPRKA
ncbi:MAG: ATP-binding cassette domain-containing protein [Desulforudis sp.]|nr:MAG: ATP-binding cassette domain-containing protein [Desulforudis sp.]